MDDFYPIVETKALSQIPKYVVVSEGYYPGAIVAETEEEASTHVYLLICQFLQRNTGIILQHLRDHASEVYNLVLLNPENGKVFLNPILVSVNDQEKSWLKGDFFYQALKYRLRQLKELGLVRNEDNVMLIALHETFPQTYQNRPSNLALPSSLLPYDEYELQKNLNELLGEEINIRFLENGQQ